MIILWWFMLLLATGTAASCPSIATLFVEKYCDNVDGTVCETPQPSTDEKSLQCSAGQHLEGREDFKLREDNGKFYGSIYPWEPIRDVKCGAGGIVATRKKGDAKNFDFAHFRCNAPFCTVDTSAVFAASSCPPTDECVEAIRNKLSISCPVGYALEVEKDDGRSVELASNICSESTILSDSIEGPIKSFRCRALRQCKMDRYFEEARCGLKEKCSENNEDGSCNEEAMKSQVSFKTNVEWIDLELDGLQCDVEEAGKIERFKVRNQPDIPMAMRCVKNAVCEVKKFPFYESSCEEGDRCSEPQRSKSISITCKTDNTFEFRKTANDPWGLSVPIECYNQKYVEQKSLTEISGGQFRCRTTRGKERYFNWDQCEEKKKCVAPVESTSDNFNCPATYKGHTWEFQAQLSHSSAWLAFVSAEYKNGVFVMKETSGQENPYIPMKLRCSRDATCEVDLRPKFNLARCPAKDVCKNPMNDTATETKIVCPLANMAVEYRSKNNEPWKELSDSTCYSQIILAGTVDVTSKIGEIRCRELRKCEMDKYYEACPNDLLCEKPDLAASAPCGPNYNLQFQALPDGDWTNINSIKCQNDRYWPVGSNGKLLDEVPIGFRCALDKKCDLSYFQDTSGCASNENCHNPIPVPDKSVTCPPSDPEMGIRVRTSPAGKWEVVNKIACKNDKFVVNDGDWKEYPLHIHCVIKKSATCDDPGRQDPDAKKLVRSYVTFNRAATWDGISSYFCDVSLGDRFLVVGDMEGKQHIHRKPLQCADDNDHSIGDRWIAKPGEDTECLDSGCMSTQPLQCVILMKCTYKTPMFSRCGMHEDNCQMVFVNDNDPMKCPPGSEMVLRFNNESEILLSGGFCDVEFGYWNFTLANGGVQQITREDGQANLTCRFNDCDMKEHFPDSSSFDCEQDERNCTNLVFDSTLRIWECPRRYKFALQYSEDTSWVSGRRFHSGIFKCCQGEFGQIQPFGLERGDDHYSSCFSNFETMYNTMKVKCSRPLTCFELNPQLYSDCDGLPIEKCEKIDFAEKLKDEAPEFSCRGNKRAFYVNGQVIPEEDMRITCYEEFGRWVVGGMGERRRDLQDGDNVVCGYYNGAHTAALGLSILLPLLILLF